MIKYRFSDWLKIYRVAKFAGEEVSAIYPIAAEFSSKQCTTYCLDNKETVMLHLVALQKVRVPDAIILCRCYT